MQLGGDHPGLGPETPWRVTRVRTPIRLEPDRGSAASQRQLQPDVAGEGDQPGARDRVDGHGKQRQARRREWKRVATLFDDQHSRSVGEQ